MDTSSVPFSPEYHHIAGQTPSYLLEMRDLIMITERMNPPDIEAPDDVQVEERAPEPTNDHIIEMLNNLMFKMRSHTEGGDGEYAFGYEAAMSAASDMVENVIRRVREDR